MATVRQRKAVQNLAENGGIVSKAMRDAGYSEISSATPKKLTNSKGFQELMGEALSDKNLLKKHTELLNSSRLDHMSFPLGPKTEKEKAVSEALPPELKTILDAEMLLEQTELTDDDIKDLLGSVNCTVRKIVHGRQARHVYFWSADNKARKDALDMAYKLKGVYQKEDTNVAVQINQGVTRIVINPPKVIETQDGNTNQPNA